MAPRTQDMIDLGFVMMELDRFSLADCTEPETWCAWVILDQYQVDESLRKVDKELHARLEKELHKVKQAWRSLEQVAERWGGVRPPPHHGGYLPMVYLSERGASLTLGYGHHEPRRGRRKATLGERVRALFTMKPTDAATRDAGAAVGVRRVALGGDGVLTLDPTGPDQALVPPPVPLLHVEPGLYASFPELYWRLHHALSGVQAAWAELDAVARGERDALGHGPFVPALRMDGAKKILTLARAQAVSTSNGGPH